MISAFIPMRSECHADPLVKPGRSGRRTFVNGVGPVRRSAERYGNRCLRVSIRELELGLGQEDRGHEVRARELCPTEIGSHEIGPPQVSPAQVRAPQYRATEVCTTQIRTAEVRSPQIETTKILAPQVPTALH